MHLVVVAQDEVREGEVDKNQGGQVLALLLVLVDVARGLGFHLLHDGLVLALEKQVFGFQVVDKDVVAFEEGGLLEEGFDAQQARFELGGAIEAAAADQKVKEGGEVEARVTFDEVGVGLEEADGVFFVVELLLRILIGQLVDNRQGGVAVVLLTQGQLAAFGEGEVLGEEGFVFGDFLGAERLGEFVIVFVVEVKVDAFEVVDALERVDKRLQFLKDGIVAGVEVAVEEGAEKDFKISDAKDVLQFFVLEAKFFDLAESVEGHAVQLLIHQDFYLFESHSNFAADVFFAVVGGEAFEE